LTTLNHCLTNNLGTSLASHASNLANNNVCNLAQCQLNSGFGKTSGGASFSSV
jgi:hypothetical protein